MPKFIPSNKHLLQLINYIKALALIQKENKITRNIVVVVATTTTIQRERKRSSLQP